VKVVLTNLRKTLYRLTHCHDCHKMDICPFWHPSILWAVIRHSETLVCRQCLKKRRMQLFGAGIALPSVTMLYMFKKYGVLDEIKKEVLKEQRASDGSAK